MYLPAKSPLIKAMWRSQSNMTLAIPLTILLYVCQRETMSFRRDHSLRMLVNNTITAFFGFVWYVGLVVG